MERIKTYQEPYDVYLDGSYIDTVYYTNSDADYVKKTLVNHDGYDSAIIVVKGMQ